jgi:hypothetical protein
VRTLAHITSVRQYRTFKIAIANFVGNEGVATFDVFGAFGAGE